MTELRPRGAYNSTVIDLRSAARPALHAARPALAAVVLALAAAGCGGSSSPSGSGAQSPPKGTVDAAYRFAACMRDHGVSGFPDPAITPNSSGGENVRQVVSKTLVESPSFPAAQKACGNILPSPRNADAGLNPAQRAARLSYMLAFAQCMRHHGVARFPDPTAQGQLSIEMVDAAGVDVRAPSVQKDALTCLPATHGLLTPAAIRRAIAHG